jgi:hypothetical protein
MAAEGAPTDYRILPGWRVGRPLEETKTRSGLLVPAGTEHTEQALALVDVRTGERFWAVPNGAWRFIWPSTDEVVVAVRESQIIAEEQGDIPGEGRYL